MKCPFCKSKLVKGEKKQYTNTAEHVSDPNHEYERPHRITWVCPDNCEMSVGSFWDEQGGWYSGRLGVSYERIFEWKQEGNHSTAAIGSWDRWMDNRNKFAHMISPYLPKREGGWDDSYKIASIVFEVFKPKFFSE